MNIGRLQLGLASFVFFLISCAGSPNSGRIIAVTGVASVATVPDRVEISVGIEKNEKNVRDAKDQSDQSMAKILAVAKSFKIPDKDVQSDYVRIDSENIFGPDGRTQGARYVARRTVKILLRDIQLYDALIARLFDAGANVLSDVNFKSSKVTELEEEARRLAIAGARHKAELMAGELGLKIGRALQVSDRIAPENHGGPSGGMMLQKAAMDANGPTLAPGQVMVTADVSITFELQ